MQNEIYIGATSRKLGLVRNRIYLERPQELIDSLKAEYPLIGLLFVPVNQLGAAQAQLNRKGTPIAKAFSQIKEVA